ncbi:MAG: class I SAM-dependent methyltransferase [Planctomycetes bacterium]|nr:class I SAM-dependent methyltransferase [Planctomycetota bacterium]
MSAPACAPALPAVPKAAAERALEACEVHAAESAGVLDELDRANALFGIGDAIARPLLAWCEEYAPRGGALRVLDAGCGCGGLLLRLAEAFEKTGLACEWIGLDPNPHAIERAHARAKARGAANVRFVCGTLADLPDGCADFAVSTFVLHHLDARELSPWLRHLRRVASSGALLLDFRRGASPLLRAAWQGALLAAGFSRDLRADGVASLRSAWTEDELCTAASAAGWHPRLERVQGLCCRLRGRW